MPEDPNVPVLAFIGRLDEQKGVDLIRDSFDWLMSEGVQLILLGSGREDLENSLRYSLASKKTLPSFRHEAEDKVLLAEWMARLASPRCFLGIPHAVKLWF